MVAAIGECYPRLPPSRLLERGFQIRSGGERHDLKAVGIRLGHTKRATPDGASGPEDGDAFHRCFIS